MREFKFRAWDKKYRFMEELEWPWAVAAGGVLNVVSRNWWEEAELMQYTGLEDKNGTPIYEGDIILLYRSIEIPREVYWEEDGCQYRLASRGDRQFDKTSILAFAKTGEIIGNIYENPELLGEKP